jgi:hypothetical protein
MIKMNQHIDIKYVIKMYQQFFANRYVVKLFDKSTL